MHQRRRQALAAAVVAELTEKRSAGHSHAEDLGDEDRTAARQSYLVTFSRPTTTTAADGTLLKAPDEYSRENIAEALLRSLELSQTAKRTTLALAYRRHFRIALSVPHTPRR